MKQNIKIAVIGGTGKSGRYLVQQLINRKIHFKLFVRNPDRVPAGSPFMEVVHGDVADLDSVRLLIQGCGAVISLLGMGVPNSAPDIFSQSTTHILQAMRMHHLTRYIVITGLNVDTPFDKKSAKVQQGTDWMKANYPTSSADKQKEYALLVASDIDWTLVRLPLIEQTDERRKVNVSTEDCAGDKISATDLACFLIDQIEDKSYSGKAPFISNG
ncbi:MAG: epimerase [Azospira oryzae]|jgi:putative NADH-flavin reductase|nr:MAG: epimerase [Azospira oryzae]